MYHLSISSKQFFLAAAGSPMNRRLRQINTSFFAAQQMIGTHDLLRQWLLHIALLIWKLPEQCMSHPHGKRCLF